MNGLTLRVKLVDGGEHTATLNARNIVAFERWANKGLGKAIGEEKAENLYYLGWLALKSAGVVVKPFGDNFLDELEDVEIIADPSSESTATA